MARRYALIQEDRLQCVAVCCSVLQCVAVWQCLAVPCNVKLCGAMRGSGLKCVRVGSGAWQWVAVRGRKIDTLQFKRMTCSALHYCISVLHYCNSVLHYCNSARALHHTTGRYALVEEDCLYTRKITATHHRNTLDDRSALLQHTRCLHHTTATHSMMPHTTATH